MLLNRFFMFLLEKTSSFCILTRKPASLAIAVRQIFLFHQTSTPFCRVPFPLLVFFSLATSYSSSSVRVYTFEYSQHSKTVYQKGTFDFVFLFSKLSFFTPLSNIFLQSMIGKSGEEGRNHLVISVCIRVEIVRMPFQTSGRRWSIIFETVTWMVQFSPSAAAFFCFLFDKFFLWRILQFRVEIENSEVSGVQLFC